MLVVGSHHTATSHDSHDWPLAIGFLHSDGSLKVLASCKDFVVKRKNDKKWADRSQLGPVFCTVVSPSYESLLEH